MNHAINNKQTSAKSTLKQQISAEVELGMALSADPAKIAHPFLEESPSHSSPPALLVKQFVKGLETTWRPLPEG